MFDAALERARTGELPSRAELVALLESTPTESERLFAAAREVRDAEVGNRVYLRGLIELGNVCSRNCLYCGIRRGNGAVRRYTLSADEIVAAAELAAKFGYGSVVLQGGERSDAAFTEFIAAVLRRLPRELGVTLSLGEQPRAALDLWRAAGARRYLLRIESSDPELFAQIHPPDASFAARRAALAELREAGFQTGTGVMIGLPGQTVEQLARDVEFFRESDVDMIGMGPYIPHPDTPLGREFPLAPEMPRRNLELALKMIATTRLVLRDVNIASSTALQALDPGHGRERGLAAGANVVMPNVGGLEHRKDYLLYAGKPGADENAEQTRRALENSIRAAGMEIAYGVPGDPKHFRSRKARQSASGKPAASR